MDPITLCTIGHVTTANAVNTGVYAHAQQVGDSIAGNMSDRFGSQPFSFTDTPSGFNLNIAGKVYSLRPDWMSHGPFEKSWSLLDNSSFVGTVGLNGMTNSLTTQGLSTKLAAGITSAMRSGGVA